jgi:E3 ubiquitin-protein ligase MARCH6
MADEDATVDVASIGFATYPADPALDPLSSPPKPSRQNTMTSESAAETCRICRSEGTVDEPLFYPCKCSGSIKFVHQECLMEWLSHSHKKHCELCKTPFRFTKLYDANMPQTLPWGVFVKRACWHVVLMIVRGCRTALVGFVWLGLVPWLIRWIWRWLFWIADAAWAREAFIQMTQRSLQPATEPLTTAELVADAIWRKLPRMAFNVTATVSDATSVNMTYTTNPVAFNWPQADPSILSSWTHLASLTPNDRVNRLILDVFEGQLITCVIITGFILVFLIREWVVQQQPLANINNVHEQLREAAERVQADNERLRRQQELLEQARARLMELQNETETIVADAANSGELGSTTGSQPMDWEVLESLMDQATRHLQKSGEQEYERFLACADMVINQIRAHANAVTTEGENVEKLSDKVYEKLLTYTAEERKEWESVIVSEIAKTPIELQNKPTGSDSVSDGESSIGRPKRPQMPGRDISSRATQIQRLLAEAEEVFNSTQQSSTLARSENADGSGGSPSVLSAPSTESWQDVTPPNGSNAATNATRPASELPSNSALDWKTTSIPITNAGPDAKINIRWSGTSKASACLKIQEKMLDVDEKLLELKAELDKEIDSTQTANNEGGDSQDAGHTSDTSENNPFRPDGPEPASRDNRLGDTVASVIAEEIGLNDDDAYEEILPHDLDGEAEATPEEHPNENAANSPLAHEPTRWERLADWFWGDIQPSTAQEPVPAAEEERQVVAADNSAQIAPFVPAADAQPAANAPNPAQPPAEQPQNDPEVVAAAQQAGLDPEAVEDAEDLEGIFELIGLQGPLIGLLQTSAFCLLLVACTILGAVIVPYLGGKGVLSLSSDPVYFFIQLPLQIASFIVDFLIDTTLVVASAVSLVVASAVDFAQSGAQTFAPSLADYKLPEKVIAYCVRTIVEAGGRLQDLFGTFGSADSWGWAFLRWSVHAHSSLKDLEWEVNATLHAAGTSITWIVETVSSGSVVEVSREVLAKVFDVWSVSALVVESLDWLKEAGEPLVTALSSLMRGTLTFSTLEAPMDPFLVYWDSTDRALAILTGYAALAALAAIYVAADTPITKSEGGRKTEKMIRDTLRQAGGVLKVILIISIEMLVFPLYCGLLLDVAFLPLFKSADVASRWAFAVRKPWLFCFVHWFVGTCYMFHFALFVGMCRKILRKGVLWFIRDPDDPTFHPVRDVLERNVITQLRKIAFSALVYGALVILCLGGVIWTIGRLLDDIFPIHWVSTEPILEFPMDMLLYNFVTPIVIRLMKPSDAVNSMYAWWLRRCARTLRLSHFLFDDRRKDEEGHLVHRSWSTLFKTRKQTQSTGEDEQAAPVGEPAPEFKKDGMYVLTPCSDQYRPPKSDEAFFHLDENDACIVDKDGKKNEHFTKIYIPPLFRIRISLFMVCLWLFSAFAGLCSTVLPLILGRYLLGKFIPQGLHVSDIYAYSLGAYIVGGILFAALKSKAAAGYIKEKAPIVDFKAWVEPLKRVSVRALKCMYVYGFFGIMLPIFFALFLQFYVVLPLHTWTASAAASISSDVQSTNNSTAAVALNLTSALTSNATQSGDTQMGSLTEHSFHVFQDYTLGLLYVRVFSRMIIAAPASRAAEAFRRVTADGYLNPNIRLATRFFVLPATIVAAVALLLPPILTKIAITAVQAFTSAALDATARTVLYRYSYPIAASIIVAVLGAAELGKATSRWRARIRDEAYLVGERLHNFGEKKPPPGSKSVIRKER